MSAFRNYPKKGYNPDQPRDENGRWGSGSGGSAKKPVRAPAQRINESRNPKMAPDKDGISKEHLEQVDDALADATWEMHYEMGKTELSKEEDEAMQAADEAMFGSGSRREALVKVEKVLRAANPKSPALRSVRAAMLKIKPKR